MRCLTGNAYDFLQLSEQFGLRPSVMELKKLDNLMLNLDETEDKSKFVGKAMLDVPLAMCKAGAAEQELPLHHHIAQLAKNSDLFLPVPST
ncbi:hypothetical protein E5288_WYG011053 [Bos mutus]|uniref:Enolase N-terminal domain-containing protein n=2 Tax=Bos mutus TaxID=72004 RepID=A0A6B0QXY3_9CETA|nr:hypothetical protein [Bos mutus]